MITKAAIVAVAVAALVGAGGGIAAAGTPENPCWTECSDLPTDPVRPGTTPAPNTGFDADDTWAEVQRLG